MSPYTAFEAPDPMYWFGRVMPSFTRIPRSWYSEGELRHGGMGESETASISSNGRRQHWSNARHIRACRISRRSSGSGALHPPNLAAIISFEGFSDWYREFLLAHSETSFLPPAAAT